MNLHIDRFLVAFLLYLYEHFCTWLARPCKRLKGGVAIPALAAEGRRRRRWWPLGSPPWPLDVAVWWPLVLLGSGGSCMHACLGAACFQLAAAATLCHQPAAAHRHCPTVVGRTFDSSAHVPGLTALCFVMLNSARFGPCHLPNTALGRRAAEL